MHAQHTFPANKKKDEEEEEKSHNGTYGKILQNKRNNTKSRRNNRCWKLIISEIR